VSLIEKFLSASTQILLATENIKRNEEKVRGLAKEIAEVDRRLIRVETYIEIVQSSQGRRTLPGRGK
jgi:hypothetical protein